MRQFSEKVLAKLGMCKGMGNGIFAILVAVILVAPVSLGGPNNVVAVSSALISEGSGGLAPAVEPGSCGPIDLTLALDDTGSMGGAINNIKAELPTIVSTAMTASGGDLRVGYITFKDLVQVHNNLTTNISAVMDSINATFASGGAGGPESSDEAKNTAVNNLPPGMRTDSAGFLGTQIGDYTTPYRVTATKIVVLITDAPPGGFNDFQDTADNIALNTTHPLAALPKGIKVSDVFVPTGGDYAGQAALLEQDANVTGGAFVTTAANGSGTGAAITSIIASCGAGKPTGTISGMKFNDLNGNGVNDAEPGLANWTITLTNESSGVVTTTTNASGNYSFTNLTDGNYTVGEVLQPGWTQTAPQPVPPGTYKVSISGGNEIKELDFGNQRIPAVEGRMTGGGSVFNASVRVTHGFELNCNASKAPNNFQVNWGKGNKFHLENLTTASCSDNPAIVPNPPNASFDTYNGTGTGRYNGASGATAEWIFTDAGEPGNNDIAKIVIKDSSGNIVLSISGNLTRGNHQAHNA